MRDSAPIIDFIHNLTWDDIPDEVKTQARRCFIDTIGTAIGGRRTELSRIIHDFAAMAYGGNDAKLWLDGRSVSIPGAAMAHGMTIDSLDIHDSCRPVKGHAGVALVPAALAAMDKFGPISGEELLTSLVMGYDIAIRAGTALHATACDYHTSGAWSALGCAAILARWMKLDAEQTRHALGIAEYHGPRSQMMRCIDYPTMVKDGSGWGAMCGTSAALMAGAGFTGAPALTVEEDRVAEYWDDLGSRWSIMIQYFKPYAVCYWAQPSIAGVLKVQKAHQIGVDEITQVDVHTFHEATRLAMRRPQNTEEAQYSLPFPMAMALTHGRLGYAELNGDALVDPGVLALAERINLVDDDAFNARFPADRLARVYIETKDGNRYDSGEIRSLWDLTAPPTNEELREKYRWLAGAYLDEEQIGKLETAVWDCDQLEDASIINRLLQ
ncbi:MAG: MmgE/PrpD family protein [Chloroflexota bacterium]